MKREELIDICHKATVPQSKWGNRDTESAQRQIGEALMLLRAGCDFKILTEGGLATCDQNIWLEIEYKGFRFFELGETEHDNFYLPTYKRLLDTNGADWYC